MPQALALTSLRPDRVGLACDQENQYLGVPHADVVAMPTRLQDLLGYSDSVDFVRGSDLLREEVKEGRGLGGTVGSQLLASSSS